MELLIACLLTVYGPICDTPPPLPVAAIEAQLECGPGGCGVGDPYRGGDRYRGEGYYNDRGYDRDRGYGDRYDRDRYPDRGYAHPHRHCFMAGGVRVCQ